MLEFLKKSNTEEAEQLSVELSDAREALDQEKENSKKLQKQLKKMQQDNDERVEDLTHAHDRAFKKLNEETGDQLAESAKKVKDLQRQVYNLQTLVGEKTDLETLSLELDNREAVLDAKEANADNFSAKLKEARDEGKEIAEDRYKSGYSDGLADGLRKAHEITAEDRRNGMQIAALAAASHQPDATKQIAQAIAKDVARALPSGSKSNGKKR